MRMAVPFLLLHPDDTPEIALGFQTDSDPLALKRTVLPAKVRDRSETMMQALFVQVKCELGKSYEVAAAIADREIASEIYSTAGQWDLLVKFYIEDGTDIGHFVNEQVHAVAGIRDTLTIMTFRAF